MAFISFECYTVPDKDGNLKQWLLLDLEQPCWEGKHASMLLISAVPLVLLHAIVVPTLIMMILRSAGERKRQTDPVIMFRYGLLHSGYRKERYWWECLVMVRKFSVIVISTFATSDQTQLNMSLAVIIIALHMHDTNRPFGHGDAPPLPASASDEKKHERLAQNNSERSLHRYEMGSLLTLLLLVWSGVFFFANVCEMDAQMGVCTVLMIVVLVSNAAYLLLLLQRCVREWGKRNQRSLDRAMHALHLDRIKLRSPECADKPARKKKKDDYEEVGTEEEP